MLPACPPAVPPQTGGFAGGEVAVDKYQEILQKDLQAAVLAQLNGAPGMRPAAPLPLLLPGMLARVDSPGNIYHQFTGIVQRVSDGRAAVLFEGGCWDKLVTFPLGSLVKTKEGPPGENPKSAALQPLVAAISRAAPVPAAKVAPAEAPAAESAAPVAAVAAE